MKKIILVSNSSWSMIKFRLGLMKELISKGYKITIIAPYDKHVEEIKLLGCSYQNIDMDNKGINPLKDLKLLFKLKNMYKKLNPDLIIHYTIKPNIYGTIAAKLAMVKSIAVVTGLGYIFINDTIVSKIGKVLYKFSFQFSRRVLFINHDDKKEFIENNLVNSKKVMVLPGEGVNTDFFDDQNFKDKRVSIKFLLIARMLFDKGIKEYVEAANMLKEKYPDAEFGLVGYLDVDNPRAISKEQMIAWQKDCNIVFYGSTDDVKSFISRSDCIVLPSYREGISMSLMESASMSKALIATNVPGCKELIENGVNGFLCNVKDSIDLAVKMELMLNLSNDERKRMGQAGRKKMIKEFDEKIVINKYFKIIEEEII
ncbi:hypothetical protein AN286_06995 [Aliarcobacter cryaerophilus ATCC 43158]|uniref:Glycosyltransferase, family 1 n=1 Tax=Aliarcobacter cryaerophilus ATCC 43158 TaxID=1032070 RepID=A0AAD0X989_9BACT|nr:glycosyltransferase family 4 protein [Aliarcobacter cryaerophilus]AYJ79915.1 glycosyltransferase, family 1 [Aliarcobacter cryaerophilus ATCC 43158]PRM96869.1 glycosyltransferase family 1 protein [Aliarcobacter cryaerophilus]QCZ24147.1 hypothetical protein AN286_06995 [Aliarcobacter cryaerophilus ATCC 43158]